MSDGFDIGRWALEDDQLEDLMSGVSPEAVGLAGNPVAEFFADANHARGVARPNPSPDLQRLFATGSAFEATGVEPGRSVLGDPAPEPITPGVWSPEETIPFRRSLADYESAQPYQQVYRASPIEAAIAILRPTGTKLLMAAALLVAAIVGVGALGIYDLPLVSTGQGDGVDVASGDGNLEDGARLPTTIGANGSTGGADSLPGPVTLVDRSPLIDQSSTDGATSTSATTSPPTTAAPDTTLEPETSTTVPDPTSTEPASTDTTPVDSTVDTSSPDTTNPVSTTAINTSTTLAVQVPATKANFAPGDVPVGSYGGSVPLDSGGCTVRLFHGSGGETSTFTRAPGELVTFTLGDGDGVRLSTGCPAVFVVS
jgi:hypothetical protein